MNTIVVCWQLWWLMCIRGCRGLFAAAAAHSLAHSWSSLLASVWFASTKKKKFIDMWNSDVLSSKFHTMAWRLGFVFFLLFTIAWRGINGSLEHTEGNQYQKWLLVFKQKSQWKLCKVDFIHYQHGKSLERSFLNCQYFEFMLAAGKLPAAFMKLKVSRCMLYAALLVISCDLLRDVVAI